MPKLKKVDGRLMVHELGESGGQRREREIREKDRNRN